MKNEEYKLADILEDTKLSAIKNMVVDITEAMPKGFPQKSVEEVTPEEKDKFFSEMVNYVVQLITTLDKQTEEFKGRKVNIPAFKLKGITFIIPSENMVPENSDGQE